MNKTLGLYYQVSDDVPPELIQKFCSDCTREDCRVSARKQETTCAATANHYDKTGRKIIEDHNKFDVVLTCGKCWKSEIRSHDNEVLKVFNKDLDTIAIKKWVKRGMMLVATDALEYDDPDHPYNQAIAQNVRPEDFGIENPVHVEFQQYSRQELIDMILECRKADRVF